MKTNQSCQGSQWYTYYLTEKVIPVQKKTEMSNQDRNEIERSRKALENQLESIKQENLVLEQETKDIQEAAERMRVQKEKILAKDAKESYEAKKPFGDGK